MTLGELSEQFYHSCIYWEKKEDVLSEEVKAAFIAFLDCLPFDVFLTNPIWGEDAHGVPSSTPDPPYCEACGGPCESPFVEHTTGLPVSNPDAELPRDRKIIVDPPSGWRYGFPRVYDPRPEETEVSWFARVGYPWAMIYQGMLKHCRWWDYIPDKTKEEVK